MKRVIISITWLILVIFLVNCSNPLPVLTLLSPDSKVAHLPTFTLTVTGTDFVSDSKIVFNGNEKSTIYVSSNELACEVIPDEIGMGGAVLPVLVRTPSPGGGDSNTLNFNVLSNFTFSSPVNVSNNIGASEAPAIAINSLGHLNCVWHDDTSGNREILYSSSVDKGVTWSAAVNLSNTVGASRFPDIAIDSSDNLNVVWHDYLNAGNCNIFFSRSSDGGSNWTSPLNIHKYSGNARDADIVVDSADNLNCAWHAAPYDDLNWEIYFSRSTNGGMNWSPPVNISNNTDSSENPNIAVDSSDNLYCVWFDLTTNFPWTEIHFSSSGAGGMSWKPEENISNTPNHNSYLPVIAIDSYDRLFVGWADEVFGNYEILFNYSVDNGNNWSSFTNISNNLGSSSSPVIAFDSVPNLNCVWWDDTSGKRDIYFSRSTDGGASWSPIVVISSPTGDSWYPDIAVDIHGNIHCVWYWVDDDNKNLEIFYSGSAK